MKTAPACLGIIMDGNRRYAREHGLPTEEGHRLGYLKAKDAAGWCREAGVKCLILYAFSSENWNRAPEEVKYLLQIFKNTLMNEAEELRKENGAIRFIGDIARFGKEFEKSVQHLEETNPENPNMTVVIALSYGGREEILRAANQIAAEGAGMPVTEEIFSDHLYTRGLPDPDLIIRTSGEHRLSGFLPWQATYSELFFPPMHWPAFEKSDFEAILAEYAERERRFGK